MCPLLPQKHLLCFHHVVAYTSLSLKRYIPRNLFVIIIAPGSKLWICISTRSTTKINALFFSVWQKGTIWQVSSYNLSSLCLYCCTAGSFINSSRFIIHIFSLFSSLTTLVQRMHPLILPWNNGSKVSPKVMGRKPALGNKKGAFLETVSGIHLRAAHYNTSWLESCCSNWFLFLEQ